MKFYLLPFFLIFSYLSQAQMLEDGCVKIDFESVLGGVPVSGMSLGDQYFDAYGVRFSLENGDFPVIVGFGPPMEAFQGPNQGADNSPDQAELGQYMLTDDGVLSATLLSPVLISFDNPIDSFSAVVLDIDADEYFNINAYDDAGVNLYNERITAGDPGTGDGLAVPFGFNQPSCFGSVHSISFDGVREAGGGFGLAMDNFIICFEGVDLRDDLEIVVTNIFCQDSPGQIEIINNGDLDLMYSIDGNNFNDTGIFTGLAVGDYLILVEDEDGCQVVLNEAVIPEGPTVIEDVIVTHTTCGEDNGSFEVIATQDEGVIYFIDAFDLSSSNVFTDLAPGNYLITIIGPSGCSSSEEVIINPSNQLFLDEVISEDDLCQQTVGMISMISSGGNGNIVYSIDNGLSFQEDSVFDSLSQGFYQLMIQDDLLCTAEDSISIGETPGVVISPIQVTGTICGTQSGIIQFTAEGGTGNLQYQLNEEQIQELSVFEDLDIGIYNIVITDDLGCVWDLSAEIEIPICPVYFPNIFTPISEDDNNEFKLYTLPGQDIQVVRYEIYDRWGSRIYSSYNFDIYSNDNWWRGRDDGYKWESGVYVYLVELEYYEGSREIFTGDISLIR